MSVLTPTRRRGAEYLDDPRVDPAVRTRSMRDVATANQWLGGRRAALGELRCALTRLPCEATLLDVGTGDADVAGALAALATEFLVKLRVTGVDSACALLVNARARGRVETAVCADALRLPFADRSVDVVLCSQLLHHFDRADALVLLAELHRIARRRVIICELQRSWAAAAGFWLLSWPLRFHPITRHDGTLSVLRGFTCRELGAMVLHATGVRAVVRRWLGFRLTASWTP